MATKVYIGDIGTEVLVNCGSIITGASNTKMKVRKPNGDIAEWAASISGTDSLIYTVVSGDFDQEGIYLLQASLTINGWSGLGETAEFRVYDPYE